MLKHLKQQFESYGVFGRILCLLSFILVVFHVIAITIDSRLFTLPIYGDNAWSLLLFWIFIDLLTAFGVATFAALVFRTRSN